MRAGIGAIVVGLFIGTGTGCNADSTATATIAMSVFLQPAERLSVANLATTVQAACSRQLARDGRPFRTSCRDGSRSYIWQRTESTEVVTLVVAPI